MRLVWVYRLIAIVIQIRKIYQEVFSVFGIFFCRPVLCLREVKLLPSDFVIPTIKLLAGIFVTLWNFITAAFESHPWVCV